jgi:hypothetical protein
VALSRTFSILLLLFVLSIILIAVSCGGGDSNLINTNQNINTPSISINTPTPVLTSKPVSAYLYISNTSLEDGENVANTTLLDIPAVNPDSSGSTPLLTQLSALQQENPQDWQGQDIKELYDKLSTTLTQSQALPQTAKVFTVYQDSLSAAPIPVNNEGYISGQAVVGDTDTNVQLEVFLDDDNYIEAETVIASDNLTSSNDNRGVTLKSCPEKIISFPGEVTILKIYSTINLEKAGLTVTLNNSGLGCLSKPVFLDICGKKKHDTAYIFFYPKKNLTTPIDTKITARTNTGLQLEIFTEIIKSTASISGKIFTTGGKPLIKGYVKSIGPKAFCKLDSFGNYTLPRVFCGHFRKIVATYWIEENGKKIRHREEKIIDFFGSDLTNFNFGEELLTPTPTSIPTVTPTPREVTDPYYSNTSIEIMMQRDLWAEDLGILQSVQKTADWLNGKLGYPVPQGIAYAKIDEYDPTILWIKFADGPSRFISTYPIIINNTLNAQNSVEKQFNKKLDNNLLDRATTVGSAKVKILAPFAWQNYHYSKSVYGIIWDRLVAAGYKDNGSKCNLTQIKDIDTVTGPPITKRIIDDDAIKKISDAFASEGHPLTDNERYNLNNYKITHLNYEYKTIEDLIAVKLNEIFKTPEQLKLIWDNMTIKTSCKITCSIKNPENIIRPEDFQDLADYGVIYVATHGFNYGIACGPMYEGDNYLKDNNWLDLSKEYNKDNSNSPGIWCLGEAPATDPNSSNTCFIEVYVLTHNFFNTRSNKDFSKSLVYISACDSYNFINKTNPLNDTKINPLSGAKAYLAYSKNAELDWSRNISYYLFQYMTEGYETPIFLFPGSNNGLSEPTPIPEGQMSVQKSIKIFSDVKSIETGKSANPDPHDYTNTDASSAQDCELKLEIKDQNEEIYFPVTGTITVEKK